ncbi:MAG: hypothetical protein EXR71_14275 [Myxococcales bacterium]|nr:hypothetical protein [Myxococcales bacterium]
MGTHVPADLHAIRTALWKHVQRDAEGLSRAAQALHGRPPEPDEWPDLLDFVATEWLDEEGLTAAERLAELHDVPTLTRWPLEVRTSLWVVDGHDGDHVRLRDLKDDSTHVVRCPSHARAELPTRTVLRARIVPWADGAEFLGEPGLYGEQGVIARLQLLDAWRQSPEPSVLAALHQRRADFARQRDQHRVWRAHFGVDLVQCGDAASLEAALARFMEVLCFADRGASGTAATRAERWELQTGKPAERIELRLGETLREGSPAMCFDPIGGIQFFPAFAELRAHLSETAPHPSVFRLWSTNPELPRLGLRLAGFTTEAIGKLGLPSQPVTPSCLPEFGEAG